MTTASAQVNQRPWPPRFTTGPGANTRTSLRSLGDLCAHCWDAVRLLGASVLDVPEFEAKLAMGETLFTITEVAAALEERIGELGGKTDRTPRRESQLAATLALPPTGRMPRIVHEWFTPLLDAFAAARFDPLLDGPSDRVRRRGYADLRDSLDWFFAVYPLPPAERTEADEQSGSPQLRRPVMGARDERFLTFAHTRDYRKSDGWESSGSDYQDRLIELLRINRDEIDALETFALSLFDLVDQAPIAVLRHLARLAWDEARHAAIGHALLVELEEDPFGYECSLIGIKIRGSMTGWDAWAQITLFGELGIIGPMRELQRDAITRSDFRTADAFAFICRDETAHLKHSRRLLDAHHPAGGLAAAGAAARSHAGRLIDEFGLLPEEQFAELNPRQIFGLLGE